mmetsp:Transcript_17002/g.51437  ORF Transcript_17002/g.51437 Transcript_17002/m.51437 type:complete len:273 (+) Transcript_17002:250-1068(+)
MQTCWALLRETRRYVSLGPFKMASLERRHASKATLAPLTHSQQVRIWDARTSKCVQAIETRGENINIRWSPDGQHIAVGDKEDNISLIETRKGKALKNIKFPHEVNEMAWDHSGRLFFLTTGSGAVNVFRYSDVLTPGELEPALTLVGHTANCYCIEFDPSGDHFAVGGADALVSLWNTKELVCVATFSNLEWPVRTISFSCDSAYIASGSEDPLVDVSHVQTGKQAYAIPCKAPSNTVAWHPTKMLLAYAGDDKDKMGRDEGSLRIFGFST